MSGALDRTPRAKAAGRDRKNESDEALRDALCDYIEQRVHADMAMDAEALLLALSEGQLFGYIIRLLETALGDTPHAE